MLCPPSSHTGATSVAIPRPSIYHWKWRRSQMLPPRSSSSQSTRDTFLPRQNSRNSSKNRIYYKFKPMSPLQGPKRGFSDLCPHTSSRPSWIRRDAASSPSSLKMSGYAMHLTQVQASVRAIDIRSKGTAAAVLRWCPLSASWKRSVQARE